MIVYGYSAYLESATSYVFLVLTLAIALLFETGLSQRKATYFLARAKVSKERAPTVYVPALRYGQTCVTPFRLRCRPTRCALAALRSDKRRQARVRSNAVLRQRCPQPEPRAAGADTRVD